MVQRVDHDGTIVLVEDHEDTLFMLTEALQAGAFHVEGYTDPREGCARLLRPPLPRLAVVDYKMPGMSGLDVARKVRAAGIGVPIVILSALDPRRMDQGELGVLGGIEVLTKPLGLLRLLDVVEASSAPR